MSDSAGPSLGAQILIIIVLTLINAFFTASEMAIVSLDKNKLNALAEEKDKKALAILKLLKEPSKFLSTVQIGITFSAFFSSASAAVGLSGPFGKFLTDIGVPFGNKFSFVLITLILSYISLVFGELVPKRVALQNSEKIARFSIGILTFFSKITKPFGFILSASTNLVLRLFGITSSDIQEKLTLESIKSVVEVGHEQGVINPIEKEMIESVIGFDNKLAEEIMTARTEVFMIDIDAPIEEYIDSMLELKYSRIPVYEEDIDNIIGILYIKDFLLHSYNVGFKNVNIRKILRPAYFVPERKNINDLFLELQNKKKHMAILIDEYGGFSGLVTMEDLIEEIMGDIDDEYDHDEPDIMVLDNKNFYVEGSVSIKEFNSKTGLKLDEESEDYDTLGGYLIFSLGYIPKEGEKKLVEMDGVKYFIENVEENRIQRVRVVLPDISQDIEFKDDKEA